MSLGTKQIYPGLRVLTLSGEFDTDSEGRERATPAKTWGHVSSFNHADHWNVVFPNGAWVVLTEVELLDPMQYVLAEPRGLQGCALALKHGQEHLGHTLLDDELMSLTEAVAGNPDHILDLYRELARAQDDAADLLALVRALNEKCTVQVLTAEPGLGEQLGKLAERIFPWEARLAS